MLSVLPRSASTRLRRCDKSAMTKTLTRTMMTEGKSPPIDLMSGWPNPALFPVAELEDASKTIFNDQHLATQSLRYGPDEGYAPLRSEIAWWLSKAYNPQNPIKAERICITGGASQNLACVLQTFTDPVYTRNVWMVSPTYFLACRIIDDSGFAGRIKAVPEDDKGIDIDYLSIKIAQSEKDAINAGNTQPKMKTRYPWRKTYKHIIYAVPTFANPSGSIMSLSRREQLVRLARDYDALIVTDDVYDMLQWPAQISEDNMPLTKASVPRLVDVDRYLDGGASEWGNAMSNGSFSKIIAPGCRTGWAEAQPKLAWALSQCGSSRSGGAPSHLVASMIHQMIADGKLDQHIHQVLLPAYAKRYRRMMQSIQSRLVPLGIELPKLDGEIAGGYFIWVKLPVGVDAERVQSLAKDQQDLTLIAGPQCQVQGDALNSRSLHRNIRLCFAYEQFELLDEGIARLADVIKRVQQSIETPKASVLSA